MSDMQKADAGMVSGISRRSFLTAAGIGVLGATSAGLLGCSPSGEGEKAQAQNAEPGVDAVDVLAAPDPIDANEISSTEEADIVIVGVGTAGLTCAVSAAQKGASVIMIAKDEAPSSQGGSNFAIGSSLTKELGIDYDVKQALRHSMQMQGYRVSEGQWATFASESGRAMDWLMDLVTPYGLGVTIEVPQNVGGGAILEEYPGSHIFYGGPKEESFGDQPDVLDALVDILTGELGQKIVFNTTAKQLERDSDGTGRVSAVIAEDQDGSYVKYVGTKAVVLATGDYGNNADLVKKYCPMAEGMPSMKAPANNTGDGHLMALWVGAAMQKCSTHGAMVFGTHEYRGLNVNKDGLRFMNERQNNGFVGMQGLMQDGGYFYQLWDSEFATTWHEPKARYNSTEPTPEDLVATFEAGIESGEIVKADTLDELAKAIDVPADVLKSTIDRYNGFCESGEDLDYYKEAEVLIPVATGPFYAKKITPNLLITLGGLDVTDKMEVKDTEGAVIEGLYALGATAGNFYGGPYTTYFCGINMGRNVCFGYLTGEQLATL